MSDQKNYPDFRMVNITVSGRQLALKDKLKKLGVSWKEVLDTGLESLKIQHKIVDDIS